MFFAAILTLWLVALLGFLNISHVAGNAKFMSVVITTAPSLLIWHSVETILKVSVYSLQYRLQNVESQYQFVYWIVLTPECLELGASVPTCCSISIFEV